MVLKEMATEKLARLEIGELGEIQPHGTMKLLSANFISSEPRKGGSHASPQSCLTLHNTKWMQQSEPQMLAI